MLKLVASASLVVGWNHLASFNDACGAELSFLRGTEFETSLNGGKLPYQFKTAFAEVIKARVASEGCTLTQQQQALFYGMEPINFLRLFDAYDTELNNTAFPCTGTANLAWSWQTAKHGIQGLLMPSSCRSADFATSKQCNGKFRIVDNLFIEVNYADKCTDPSKAGYGLPQMSLSCSGSMCATLGMPCGPSTSCGGGSTCHTFTDSALSNTMEFFLDTGLFNNLTDTCLSGAYTFPEQFMSDVLNNVANMLGLTSTVSTERYTSVSMCGVGEIDRRFNPSRAPTPAPMFRCNDNTLISFSQVCDGTSNCGVNNDDEVNCTACTQPGFVYTGYGPNSGCCPICYDGVSGCSSSHCSQSFYSSRPPIEICNSTAWGLSCPDLTASTPATLPASQPMASVSSSNPNEHILGFLDCDGNLQIGNTNDMFVGNAKLPIQKIAKRVEAILKDREPCRAGTAVTTWARYFFPWAVNFWGGVFFDTQASANIFGNVNPGVKVDDSLKYYNWAHQWNTTATAPYANVANAPASCDATTTGNGVCELALTIGEWFAGSSFPAGWSSATTVHAKAASTCTSSSSLPQAYLTCEGPCTATSKSGCCIMKEPFMPSVSFSCPAGYVLDTIDSGVTDFLFTTASTASKDTTIINFASLVATRSSSFGANAPFVSVGTGTNTQFCRINGSDFGTNTEGWANKTATDRCPYPASPAGNGTDACPQFLAGGGMVGCGASCVTMPVASQCPASGCPSTTPTNGGGGGTANSAVSAGLSVASALVIAMAL